MIFPAGSPISSVFPCRLNRRLGVSMGSSMPTQTFRAFQTFLNFFIPILSPSMAFWQQGQFWHWQQHRHTRCTWASSRQVSGFGMNTADSRLRSSWHPRYQTHHSS
ncbi:unnamed protein product [Kuraishia capsulata CBS 1993]|uniref:Uncharacterized protein n=1 Tax=Kuraishia capsulata CBS 1993 TaxID=1382522 RepID=W6MK25_9ASCO|nr:uncharacterized protein KUCA_T00002640001 [Kuraishia capsulata CBS 1993]CDK26666.1 unnamed protein product [Kuraishia capsulata CBS 1993]